MRLDAFDYHLPQSLVAQRPLSERTASRLMVVDRDDGTWQHRHFRDLPGLLDTGDVVVLNRSRVIPARLHVRRRSGGRVELFVLRIVDDTRFVALGNPMKKLRAGDTLHGDGADFSCRIRRIQDERSVLVEVEAPQDLTSVLDRFGHTPLPPYIRRPDLASDRTRYQTVYADEDGSVAAPTAGLHFDHALLANLNRAGVKVCSLVLHVGLGTFMPLTRETVEDNTLHSEYYRISGQTIETIRDAKHAGKRIVVVGTTSTRVLETLWRVQDVDNVDAERVYDGDTELFIYPGFEFQVIDAMITNFHLPRSSLLLLVSAFLGRDKTLACYEAAVRERYRFFSYGDAMLICEGL